MTGENIGTDTTVQEGATIGHAYDEGTDPPVIGSGATVRAGTIIYDDVVIGDRFNTGHHALVRERTTIGHDVLVGTHSIIDGYSALGSRVSLQSNVYVPSYTEIGDDVFVGPNAVLTNDPYPIRTEHDLAGPTLKEGCSIGANATLLPDVTVGERSFVAAGAVVTQDVPPETLAVGVPAAHRPLPPALDGRNDI